MPLNVAAQPSRVVLQPTPDDAECSAQHCQKLLSPGFVAQAFASCRHPEAPRRSRLTHNNATAGHRDFESDRVMSAESMMAMRRKNHHMTVADASKITSKFPEF